MALTCPLGLSGVSLGFTEFIDCGSVNINYNILGIATITFVVISTTRTPQKTYTSLSFGGVNFTGFVNSLEVRQVPGSLVYEHRYSITATGCN